MNTSDIEDEIGKNPNRLKYVLIRRLNELGKKKGLIIDAEKTIVDLKKEIIEIEESLKMYYRYANQSKMVQEFGSLSFMHESNYISVKVNENDVLSITVLVTNI